MLNEVLMIITLISIWFSILMSMITLGRTTHFWLKQSRVLVDVKPLKKYPKVSTIVPAHSEELVIAQTTQALLDLNYLKDKLELLLYADNYVDKTVDIMRSMIASTQENGYHIQIIERKGAGGKAGVLNDALKIAKGDYLTTYDVDAMPEKNALYLLVRGAPEDPQKHVAVFGRNKIRNAK